MNYNSNLGINIVYFFERVSVLSLEDLSGVVGFVAKLQS